MVKRSQYKWWTFLVDHNKWHVSWYRKSDLWWLFRTAFLVVPQRRSSRWQLNRAIQVLKRLGRLLHTKFSNAQCSDAKCNVLGIQHHNMYIDTCDQSFKKCYLQGKNDLLVFKKKIRLRVRVFTNYYQDYLHFSAAKFLSNEQVADQGEWTLELPFSN